MNFNRISQTVDIDKMQDRHVTMIGGSNDLAANLSRCGLRNASLVDFDTVSTSNVARQDFSSYDITRRKVEVTAERMLRINPDMQIETHVLNYCALSPESHDRYFGHTDLIIVSADFFPADARANREAIRLGIPILFIGIYKGGRAGEIIFWHPDVTPACYRCICSSRYQAFAQGQGNVSSAGGTIFDLRLVDAIAGPLAVGLLTRGSHNRYGRLIDQLGNRNLLQVKMDPEYTLNGRDIFKEYLGDTPANFSFTTIALEMEREVDCPDCSHLIRHADAEVIEDDEE